MPDYPDDIAAHAADPPPFGSHIRNLRKAAGLTLEQVGVASGISRAALSKIERSEMSPTYETLLKLAHGLNLDLATLVSGRRPGGGGIEVTRTGRGAEYCDERFAHRLLAPDLPDRGLYSFVTEVLATRLEDYDAWDRHDSEDLLYVLEGAVAVHLEGRETVELRTGDALQMDGRIAHAMVALPADGGDDKPFARVLWVSAPLG